MSLTFNPPTIWEYQTPATLNQATPVQNTWYTILETTNTRIYGLAINVEDANETLEVRATVDGETINASALAATHSTEYMVHVWPRAITQVLAMYCNAVTATNLYQEGSHILEGKSVKLEIRKTTATGAGNLMAIASYGQLKTV